MKERLRVAAIQCKTRSLSEKHFNFKETIRAIENVGKRNDLMVFPELGLTGYGGDPASWTFRKLLWKEAESIPGPTTVRVADAAKKAGCHVAFGLAERSTLPFVVYNAAVLVGPDGYIGHTRKTHLVGEDDAPFDRGDSLDVFSTDIGVIGLMVCYDMWFPEVGRILALRGAELIAILSSAFAGARSGGIGSKESKKAMWDTFSRSVALSNLVHVVACNGAGRVFMGKRLGYWERLGRTKIVDALGRVVAETTTNRETIVRGVLTQARLQQARTYYSLFRDRVPQLYGPLTQ